MNEKRLLTVMGGSNKKLLRASFTSGIDGFTDATWVDAEDAILGNGYISIPTNITITKPFIASSSGIIYTSIYIKVADDEVIDNANTKNTWFYLLPTVGTIGSADSLATFAINRRAAGNDPASTTTEFKFEYRDDATFKLTTLIARQIWWKIGCVINLDTKRYSLYLNDVLWIDNIVCPNAAAADLSRFTILNSTLAPATLFDEIYITK